MTDVLCTACGCVGAAKTGACASCGSKEVLPADSPSARKFIERRAAKQAAAAGKSGELTARAAATGKVLGRAFGKLIGK